MINFFLFSIKGHFDLNAPNAELQKLVIAVDGPSKADIQIEVVETGIYRVYYKCQSPGYYHLSLTYNGVHIDGSPYHLTLHARPSQEQVVPPPTTPIRVFIEPIEFYVRISYFFFRQSKIFLLID